jgi:ketosteroid isomerase-like protein
MSRENVDVVHQIAAGLGRRDLELFLEVTDPAVEWHASISVISEGGAYHGHDGVRQYMSDVDETFESLDATLDRVLDVGDLVLAVGRLHYRGKISGVETDVPMGWVFKSARGRSSTCGHSGIPSRLSEPWASMRRVEVPRLGLSRSLPLRAKSGSARIPASLGI